MATMILDEKTPKSARAALIDMLVEVQTHSENESSGPKSAANQRKDDATAFVERILSGATSSKLMIDVDAKGEGQGFVLFTVCAGYGGDWIWLHEIFTRAEQRAGGIGKRMCLELGTWGKKLGLKSLVGITDEKNTGVRKLATEFGMTQKPQIWLSLTL